MKHFTTIAAALAMAGLATPAMARDWGPVTQAQNDLARELTGRPGPFAVPLPDAMPTTIGTIAAADLLERGCKRVPGPVSTERKQAALLELTREAAIRKLNANFTLANNGGDFSVLLLGQILAGCPATTPGVPAPDAAALRAQLLDQVKAAMRAAIEGVK